MEFVLSIIAVVLGSIGLWFGYQARQEVKAMSVVVGNNHLFVTDRINKVREALIEEIAHSATEDSEFRKNIETKMYGGTD